MDPSPRSRVEEAIDFGWKRKKIGQRSFHDFFHGSEKDGGPMLREKRVNVAAMVEKRESVPERRRSDSLVIVRRIKTDAKNRRGTFGGGTTLSGAGIKFRSENPR